VTDGRPIVVVGAHLQGLVLDVEAVPHEGETVLASTWTEPLDGGKATSQAIVARRLGAPVSFVTILGNDDRGARWRDVFDQEGLDCSAIKVVDAPTDVGISLLPPSGIPAIVSVLATNARLDADFVVSAASTIRSASVVVCQLECPLEAVTEAFRVGFESGACTILNPAPSAPLPDALLAHVELLVPNEHEAADLAADLADADAAPEENCRLLANRYPHLCVVVTAGAAGAFYAERGGRVHRVAAPFVELIDTSGAGDAFVGALAVAVRNGALLDDAVRFAVRAASISVTRRGTVAALPRIEEVAH
jgi:ribokinase